jgi:thioredoxin 1
MDELDTILSQSSSKLVVIDFYSDNCPPCEAVAPLFEELANEFGGGSNNDDDNSDDNDAVVVFCKINATEHPLITQRYGVTGWPTFLFYKDGKVQAEIVGGKLAEATLYEWMKLLMPKKDDNKE